MAKSEKSLESETALTNGNGNGETEEIDEAEFFLVPLLATEPLPYLFDGEGNPVNARGDPLTNGNGIPKAIRKLQEDLRPRRESEG